MADVSPRREGVRLFALVFLTLYLELALIRFTSAEVIYLGYFANFVLTAVFFGLGVGFLLADRKIKLFDLLPQLLLAELAFVLLTRIDVSWLRQNLGPLFFGTTTRSLGVPMAVALPLLFFVTALVFACVAQETARAFAHFKPLVAYSIDIGGSLVGIIAFTVHSRFGGTPVQWFAIAFGLIVVLSRGVSRFNALLLGAFALLYLIGARPMGDGARWPHEVRWSPYQRLDIVQKEKDGRTWVELSANGVGHQTMQPVGTKEPMYDWPYQVLADETQPDKKFHRVLVIGAGSGTDVSYALHYGVDHVDAVEIDPEIQRAGKELHPEQPYANPKVTPYVNDGRAFMQRATGPYDLVIFALPDSLALLSGYGSVRLESYLFTVESFTRAKALLAPRGVLVLYNYYRRGWLVEKLADTLEQAFGHPPVVAQFSDEQRGALAALAIGPDLEGQPVTRPRWTVASDDWPFLYMERPHLPPMYLMAMGLFVAAAIVALAGTGNLTRSALGTNLPYLLTGAAFMMLETKSLIQFTLLFGATWQNTSLVFSAVLVSVLAANALVSRNAFARPVWLFIALLATLAVAMAVPLRSLLSVESLALRYVLASLLLVSPVFFANLVFGHLFRNAVKSTQAFGFNVLGTMIGGALDYLAMAVGYTVLTSVIALLYVVCAAMVLRPRTPGASQVASA